MVYLIDVFCGVGGLSFGFELCGGKTVLGVDNWEEPLKVFKKAFPKAKVLKEDVRKLTGKELLKEVPKKEEPLIVVGGPPCQAFSTAGKRALDDPRASLVKEFLRLTLELRPDVVVFENVKGFTSFAKGQLVSELVEAYVDAGYCVSYGVLNAKNFSVPQNRDRFILIASLDKEVPLPSGNYAKRGKYWTFEEATSDLPPVQAGEEASDYASEPRNELQRYYRINNPKLTLHLSPRYSEKLLKMMEFIPEGKSAHEVLETIPPQYRPTSGYKNTYARIRREEPSPTITRNFCVVSSQNCIHPYLNRGLTYREAIRLQSFPDDYPFDVIKSKSALREVVGNAVPPLMSFGIALRIFGALGIKPEVESPILFELLSYEELLRTSEERRAVKLF